MVAVFEAGQHRMAPVGPGCVAAGVVKFQVVPAHMGDFEAGVVRLEGRNLAGHPAEARRLAMLQAAVGEQLHADADAEKRHSARRHRFRQRFNHTVHCIQPATAVGEGALPRQHDMARPGDPVGIAGRHDRQPAAGLAGHADERLLRRTQIAGAIVDDGDAVSHRLPPAGPKAGPGRGAGTGKDRRRGYREPPSTPLVEGTASALRGSGSMALRSERASPLKQLSTIWWLFSP